MRTVKEEKVILLSNTPKEISFPDIKVLKFGLQISSHINLDEKTKITRTVNIEAGSQSGAFNRTIELDEPILFVDMINDNRNLFETGDSYNYISITSKDEIHALIKILEEETN